MLSRLPALQTPGIPDGHLVHRDAHGKSCIAAEVLIGQEQNSLASRKRPLERRASVGGGTHQSTALPAECLDSRGRVHIGQRNRIGRQSQAFQRLPASLDLRDLRHVSHGAAGVQIRQDHLLVLAAQHIRALGHEMHAAEDDVVCRSLRGNFGELVAVAGEVGETNDFIALVVMPKQDRRRAKPLPGCRNACVHAVIGKSQVVFQAAGICGLRRDRRNVVNNPDSPCPPSVRPTLSNRRTGMLKALAAAVNALSMRSLAAAPLTGMLQPF